ncbi:amino acid ABC transporter permease [Allobranchiibius sp. CTAmp26]|uniref:amino acid ABC transporter permease n=1 Tax=Allobranchiibius sp. CTAmp26 TaxID=2815214 RepID=UPI0027DCA6C5|nr:amino acid ABC transporter permease [Allobranchiibius sp. CTAmp26]
MSAETADRPGRIDARPVRHPGRYVAIVVIAVIVAMMVSSAVTNANWDWSFAFQIMKFKPVVNGLWRGTIVGTVGAMVIGVVLGVILAIMRLSDNPVLRGVAAVYVWFFRSIPRLVLLVMFGTGLGYLYPSVSLGIPFAEQLGHFIGLSADATTVGHIDVAHLSNSIIIGILGLGLSEAAYMAEIARAGIQSVDQGQREAAQALGMSAGKSMRRVVLPQAMRVIVPPTGNETLAMVKDTSLLSAIPISVELFFQTERIGSTTFKIMPAIMAAVLWYLIICSILAVVQSFLERKFGRGIGNQRADGGLRARMLGLAGGGPR